MTNHFAKTLLAMPVVFAACVGLLHAQSAAPPEFEVASIRPHPLPAQGGMRRPWSPNIDCGPIAQCGLAGNRFTEVASLIDLIMDAYSVKRFQVSGLPNWGDSGRDIYDIAAVVPQGKPPEGGTPTLDQARRMLQTLLADRFQLKLHHETKELPVYALVVAKNGPKLKPTTVACGLPEVAGGGGRGGASKGGGDGAKGGGPGLNQGGGAMTLLNSWALMPEMLAMFADRPIIDKTGLQEPAYCTLDGLDPLFSVNRSAPAREVEVAGEGNLKREPQSRMQIPPEHPSSP